MRFSACFLGALAGVIVASFAHEPHAPTTPSGTDTPADSPTFIEASPPPADSEPAPDQVARRAQEADQRPNDPAGWCRLGDALMQRSREVPGQAEPLYGRAETAYRRALELDARHVAALVGLAWVANSRHDFDAGGRWAREALSIESHLPEAHALLGDAAVERGDYEAAFEHCQAALDQRPDLASYARSAHLLWLTGDARRAKALMYRAIQAGGPHAENTAWCQAELALMMFHQGSLVPAAKQIEQALARAPRNPHVLTVMGRIKAAQGDYPQAIRFYEQANALAPRHAALAALTDLYLLSGDSEMAERMYQQVCELHTHHSHAHEHSHDGEHTHDEAHAQDANQAHEDDPGRTIPGNVPHTHGSVELARFLADQDREPAKALGEAEAAVRTLQSVHALDTLAWCYYRNGRFREAQETIQRALRWRTPDAAILFHAGMIHAALGEREPAKRYLYQALNLNPHFDPVQAKVAADRLRTLSRSAAPPPAP